MSAHAAAKKPAPSAPKSDPETLPARGAGDVLCSIDWDIAFSSAPGDIWKDTSGIETVRQFASNLAWLVKKLAQPTA